MSFIPLSSVDSSFFRRWTPVALTSYLALLAGFGKQFSYLSVEILGVPLFVGEAFLGIGIIWAATQIKQDPCLKTLRIFWILISAFILWSSGRAIFSMLNRSSDMPFLLVLRDSALFYQCLWVAVGYAFSRHQLTRLYSWIFIATGAFQVLGWLYSFLPLQLYDPTTNPWGKALNPLGNEVISPLFPLAFALWEERRAGLLALTFGNTLALQLVYFKRNWMFSVFAIAGPFAIFSGANSRSVFRKAATLGAALAVSLGAGLSSVYLQNSGFRLKSFEHWFYHGETVYSQDGAVSSRMGWRMHLWKQTMKGIQKAPYAGNGFGPRMFETVLNNAPAMHEGKWISGPHNSFLSVWFRTGLIGLALLISAIASAAYCWFRTFEIQDSLSLVTAASFLSVCFYAFFNVCLENPQAGTWFWLFLGAAGGLSLKDSKRVQHGR